MLDRQCYSYNRQHVMKLLDDLTQDMLDSGMTFKVVDILKHEPSGLWFVRTECEREYDEIDLRAEYAAERRLGA